MGKCASTPKHDDDVGQTAVTDDTKHTIPTTSNTNDMSTRTDSGEDARDVDLRETVKAVTLLIIDRLIRALEYERDGFQDLAIKRGKRNYMELAALGPFEKFLAETLNVQSPARPDVDASHIDYENQRITAFIHAASDASFRPSALVNKQQLLIKLQEAAKITQKELLESARVADASDLKIHLNFFARAFDFVNGDIINQPELLYKNIDGLTREEEE